MRGSDRVGSRPALSCVPARTTAKQSFIPPRQPANENGIRMGDCCLKSVNVGTGAEARAIAVRQRVGGMPGLFWLGGFKSDMAGTKAEALDRWAAENDRACARFDYSGHGESGGTFFDGTIGRWLEEALAVLDSFARGPQIVIGSSMGAWGAALLARACDK